MKNLHFRGRGRCRSAVKRRQPDQSDLWRSSSSLASSLGALFGFAAGFISSFWHIYPLNNTNQKLHQSRRWCRNQCGRSSPPGQVDWCVQGQIMFYNMRFIEVNSALSSNEQEAKSQGKIFNVNCDDSECQCYSQPDAGLWILIQYRSIRV